MHLHDHGVIACSLIQADVTLPQWLLKKIFWKGCLMQLAVITTVCLDEGNHSVVKTTNLFCSSGSTFGDQNWLWESNFGK